MTFSIFPKFCSQIFCIKMSNLRGKWPIGGLSCGSTITSSFFHSRNRFPSRRSSLIFVVRHFCDIERGIHSCCSQPTDTSLVNWDGRRRSSPLHRQYFAAQPIFYRSSLYGMLLKSDGSSRNLAQKRRSNQTFDFNSSQ